MVSMKLKHYFQAQHIKLLYAKPLEEVFWNKDVLGRIRRWAAELNEHIVNYKHLLVAMWSPHTLDWTPAAYDTILWILTCDRAWGGCSNNLSIWRNKALICHKVIIFQHLGTMKMHYQVRFQVLTGHVERNLKWKSLKASCTWWQSEERNIMDQTTILTSQCYNERRMCKRAYSHDIR